MEAKKKGYSGARGDKRPTTHPKKTTRRARALARFTYVSEEKEYVNRKAAELNSLKRSLGIVDSPRGESK